MSFGAWCDRQYGFEYTGVRAHHGLAWFPLLTKTGEIDWRPNQRYKIRSWSSMRRGRIRSWGWMRRRACIGSLWTNPDSVMFVAEPGREAEVLENVRAVIH